MSKPTPFTLPKGIKIDISTGADMRTNYEKSIKISHNNKILLYWKIGGLLNVARIKSCCGVKDIVGIPTNAIFLNLKAAFPNEWKQIFMKAFEKFDNCSRRAHLGGAFYIFTDNIGKKGTVMMHEILDEMCPTQTPTRINPGSKNRIKMWVYHRK